MVNRCKELKKLKIPYFPSGDRQGNNYNVNTKEEKIVFDYTGYNFDRIEKLGVFEYWLFLHDAVIYNHSMTEDGRKYLDDCYRMEQIKPDRKALREKFNDGGE